MNNLKNKELYLCILLGIAVVVIFWSGFPQSETKTKTASTNENYVAETEKRIAKILSQISGAGDVDVVITVQSGMSNVYYTKEDGSILTSGGKPLTVREDYPKVVGVVVVAEGASSYAVKMKLQSAVTSLLSVNGDCVQIYEKS